MHLPQWLARFNKHVTNPVQRLWAGWIPMHGILLHVGRRSGKSYRTPLVVFSAEIDGQPALAILLTYGPDRDWLKNLNAAGGGGMRRHGKNFGVADPQVMTKAQAVPYVKRGLRPIFSVLPFEEALLLTRIS